MANVLFGFPLYEQASVLYTPTFSGGSYEATLPLSNVAHRSLHKVARTTDDALTSTIAKVDLGVARSIRLVAIPKHNLSTAAKARVRLWAAVPVLETALSTWTEEGTSVLTTGQADPFAGTRAVLLTDNDAGANEAINSNITFTGNGTKSIAVHVREGSRASSEFGVYDRTAGVFRHRIRVTWTAGTPALSTVDGAGTLFTPINVGGGFWLVQCTVDSVTATNDNEFYLYAALWDNTSTGTTYYYEAMAFDHASQPIVEDTGVDDAWPSGLDAEEADGINIPYVHILSSATSARYVRVELADTANADQYVELGRLIVAGGYQPTINFERGFKLGLEDDTIRTVTDGGAAVYQEKSVRRTAVFSLPDISENEGFLTALRMQRRLGKSGQLFFVMDPDDDAEELAERSFLCVQRELSGLELPYPLWSRNRAAFQLIEEI